MNGDGRLQYQEFVRWIMSGNDGMDKAQQEILNSLSLLGTSAFEQILGEKLLGKDGPVSTSAASEGKTVGLYLSAQWCAPCKSFNADLVDVYNKSLRDKSFEIVFASSDRDEASLAAFAAKMPWLALPFDSAAKRRLTAMFIVSWIHSLVVLAEDGSCITNDGRSQIHDVESFPWVPAPEGRGKCDRIHEDVVSDGDCLLSQAELGRLMLETGGCLPDGLRGELCEAMVILKEMKSKVFAGLGDEVLYGMEEEMSAACASM